VEISKAIRFRWALSCFPTEWFEPSLLTLLCNLLYAFPLQTLSITSSGWKWLEFTSYWFLNLLLLAALLGYASFSRHTINVIEN